MTSAPLSAGQGCLSEVLSIVWDRSWSLAKSSAPGLPSGCLASLPHGYWILRMSVLRKKPGEAEWLFLTGPESHGKSLLHSLLQR